MEPRSASINDGTDFHLRILLSPDERTTLSRFRFGYDRGKNFGIHRSIHTSTHRISYRIAPALAKHARPATTAAQSAGASRLERASARRRCSTHSLTSHLNGPWRAAAAAVAAARDKDGARMGQGWLAGWQAGLALCLWRENRWGCETLLGFALIRNETARRCRLQHHTIPRCSIASMVMCRAHCDVVFCFQAIVLLRSLTEY